MGETWIWQIDTEDCDGCVHSEEESDCAPCATRDEAIRMAAAHPKYKLNGGDCVHLCVAKATDPSDFYTPEAVTGWRMSEIVGAAIVIDSVIERHGDFVELGAHEQRGDAERDLNRVLDEHFAIVAKPSARDAMREWAAKYMKGITPRLDLVDDDEIARVMRGGIT